MISLWTRVVASGMIEWAQNAISRPVSRVSPRPRFDRNHCLLSSTKLTRQMGTFNAVPQSAVILSNSWWRGVSSLRAVRRRFGGARLVVEGVTRPSTRRARRRGGASRRRLGWMAGGASTRVARRLRGGRAQFHDRTLVSYSSKLRSVDMRSSSSSGIGQDMVESLRASYQNPCWAARRRVRSRALRQLVTGEVVTT